MTISFDQLLLCGSGNGLFFNMWYARPKVNSPTLNVGKDTADVQVDDNAHTGLHR